MDKEPKVREKLATLFESQGLAVLATHQDDTIHGSLVAIVVAVDLRELVFATGRSTRKYAHLISNPNVALVVDNRTNQEADFQQAIAVTIMGDAAEITGEERKSWIRLYLKKHPGLKDFVMSPTCALVRVRVSKYSLVERFQNVTELRMEPCDT